MIRTLLGFLTTVLVALTILAGSGQAQALGSVLGAGNEEVPRESDLAKAVRDAAKSGMRIVVIDSEGRLIGADASDAPVEAAPPPTEGSALMRAQQQADAVRDALFERIGDLPAAINEVLYILRAASPDGTLMFFAEILMYALLLLGAGVAFEIYVLGRCIAKSWVVRRIKEDPQGYSEKMPFLAFRFVMGVVGSLVSIAVAYILGLLIFPPIEDTAVQFTVTLINLGYFACRFLSGLWRMIFSPFLSQYRIPALDDREAARAHRWFWMVGSYNICALLFATWIRELGLNYDVFALITALLTALVVVLNVIGTLVNRRALSKALRGGKSLLDCGWPVRIISQIWAPLAILYLIFAWSDQTIRLVLGDPGSFPLIAGAYVILVSIIVVYGVINFIIERSFARARVLRAMRARQAEIEATEEANRHAAAIRSAGSDHDEPDLDGEIGRQVAGTVDPPAERVDPADRADTTTDLDTSATDSPIPLERELSSFEALARRVAGILAFVAGIYAFFYIWDTESSRMVESAADRMLDIMVIIFIGYIVYHAFRIWIDNKIAEESGDEDAVQPGDEGGASSASRLATLLPLFRNVVLIVVVVSIGLIVLMELGINVGPLFAGAGIVGIAIGFGSQALVQDIFAGAFFLFDDAFRKGEYLDVGGVKGTVEKISVRSFQLRHHLGALHTIPFGQIQVMTNYSRDWVMMKLPLRVTYDTDVEKVRKLIKKLGQRLLDDPVIGNDFIQPLKSQGVIEMQDSAMIIRVKFMTKPGDQWVVRKRVYEEIRLLFEQNGIKFAHREVTVRLADGKAADLTEEEKHEVAAAAQASVEEDAMAQGSADDRADDR